MNISNTTTGTIVVECCKIWPKPDGVISGLHFVYSAAAFLLAALFFCILSVEHKIVEFIQDEKAGGSIGFWCPPFMCIFIGVDTLIVGLGTYDYNGTCCLVAESVLHARYVVRSIIHPLVLISTFEQTYLTFKRRSANFCCIKFDDGHRKKNTHACSRIARASAWIYGLGMFAWTLSENISLIYEPVEPSKMRRFTTKSLNVPDPWSVDVLELSLFLIFLFYLSAEIWRYGTLLAYQMTATCFNKWCVMFVATTLILVSYLLPVAQSIYFADLSLVIFLFANFRVELMILEDLRIARALQKNFDLKGEELRRQTELNFALQLQHGEENNLLNVSNPMLVNETPGNEKVENVDHGKLNNNKEDDMGEINSTATNNHYASFETPKSKTTISEVELNAPEIIDDNIVEEDRNDEKIKETSKNTADVNDIGILLDPEDNKSAEGMKDDNDNNVTVNDAECQILADDNANAITDSIGATKTMDGSGAEDNIKAQSKKEDDLLLPAKIESTKTVDGNDSEDNIKTKSKKEDDILLPTKAESTDATNR
jgi:hypothetical protein